MQQTAPAPHGHPYAQSGTAAYPDWVDKLPGFLGRLLKKYGWIFGVRIAVSGALFTVMGFVGKAMFNALTVTSLHSTTSVTAYDNAGNIIDLGKYGLSASDFGGAGGPLGSSVSMVSRMPNPADILLNFIIGVGLVLLIGGAALAWYLKKKGSHA